MGPQPVRPGRGLPRTARLLVVAAALVGVLAMHGLGDHGAGHEPGVYPVAHALGDSAPSHPHADQSAPAVSALRSPETSPASPSDGFMIICLAVLLGGIVLLVGLGRGRPVTQGRPPALAVVRPSRSRRERDPPDLFALSVQRC